MTTPPPSLARFPVALAALAGGYLRNTVRVPGETCQVCTTRFMYTRTHCEPCDQQRQQFGDQLADAVGIAIYARDASLSQSGRVMHGYKASPPEQRLWEVASLLAGVTIGIHSRCAERLTGAHPVDGWSTVPSGRARGGEHPMHRLAAAFAPGEEVVVRSGRTTGLERRVDPSRIDVARPVQGTHLLVLDDTWTTGAQAQSVAVALRQAGAERTSILTLARWYNFEWGDNLEFAKQHMRNDLDPSHCPWTAGQCP